MNETFKEELWERTDSPETPHNLLITNRIKTSIHGYLIGCEGSAISIIYNEGDSTIKYFDSSIWHRVY